MKKQILIGAFALLTLAACSTTKPAECPGKKMTDAKPVVYFAFNSAELTPVGEATLREVATMMKTCPYKKTVITGYTDNIGTEIYNYKLGDERAMSTKKYLEKQGVPSYQVQVKSDGQKDPAACNTTAAGRAENRRAVIQFK